jgi:hypothetical protein
MIIITRADPTSARLGEAATFELATVLSFKTGIPELQTDAKKRIDFFKYLVRRPSMPDQQANSSVAQQAVANYLSISLPAGKSMQELQAASQELSTLFGQWKTSNASDWWLGIITQDWLRKWDRNWRISKLQVVPFEEGSDAQRALLNLTES